MGLIAVTLARPALSEEEAAPAELFRVRITNQSGGAVEFNSGGGVNWETLGTVTRPATALGVGTDVLSVGGVSTVVGVGPEQWLIRVPAPRGQYRQLRVAVQGESPSNATISTDLKAHSSLFHCLAPSLGSQVLLEGAEKTGPLPPNYLPRLGDRLVFVVGAPGEEPPSVSLENKLGGEVLYAVTGGIPRVVGRVKQPLRGIGRYVGTERAGCGAVVAWSPTAVVVASSGRMRLPEKDDQPAEERGGFVIQPAEPVLRGITHPASQLLIEAIPEGTTKFAISPFFALPASLSSGDPYDKKPTRVEIRIDEGMWEALPDLRGTVGPAEFPQALAKAFGPGRMVKTGITHLRIVFGGVAPDNFRRRVRLALTPLEEAPQRGVTKIKANVMGEGIAFVSFLLNGRQVKLTNLPPYVWEWDTTRVPNGEHLIEIRGLDSKTALITTVVRRVLVDN